MLNIFSGNQSFLLTGMLSLSLSRSFALSLMLLLTLSLTLSFSCTLFLSHSLLLSPHPQGSSLNTHPVPLRSYHMDAGSTVVPWTLHEHGAGHSGLTALPQVRVLLHGRGEPVAAKPAESYPWQKLPVGQSLLVEQRKG